MGASSAEGHQDNQGQAGLTCEEGLRVILFPFLVKFSPENIIKMCHLGLFKNDRLLSALY